MKIQQFRFSSDNLGYVVHHKDQAVAVDGGHIADILGFIRQHHLTLTHVLYTHEHPDHTVGCSELQQQSGALHLPFDALIRQSRIPIADAFLEVWETPGHTTDSVCFYTGDSLLTGDTLFNGTVGNCFSGDLKAFYKSIDRLLALPPETLIYAGHDYVTYAMAFARLVEPDNPNIEAYLKKYNPDQVVSTLADELKVNPYLRFNTPEMIAVLQSRGLPVGSAPERWESVMQLD